MARYMTSNELIASAKSRAMLPTNQNTFQTVDFLRFANEELDNAVVPSILKLHDDYYLTSILVPLVSNKSNYKIPYRAIGNKLRDVAYKDTNGSLYELSRISIGDVPSFQLSYAVNSFGFFYVTGDEVNLIPEPTSGASGNLLFSLYLRPNALVDESRSAEVKFINFTTGEVIVDGIPKNFDSSIVYDFIQTRSPHKILKFDVPVLSLNSVTKTITFDPSNMPSDLAVGDHIMQAEETIIPQIPTELHSLLSHRVAMRCLEALGDQQGLSNASAKLVEMENNLQVLIDNRVEEAPMKVVNRYSPMRSSINGKRNGRRR